MTSPEIKLLVNQLKSLLEEGNAHATFDDAVKGVPSKLRPKIIDKLPYSIWQLVEHIRIAQQDILEFSQNPDHKSPKWPEGYWVENPQQINDKDWEATLTQIKKDRHKFIGLLEHPHTDLFENLEHGKGQNLLREALLIDDHTAYHTGEIVLLRRLLDCWN